MNGERLAVTPGLRGSEASPHSLPCKQARGTERSLKKLPSWTIRGHTQQTKTMLMTYRPSLLGLGPGPVAPLW